MEKVKTFFTLHLVHIFEATEAFNGQIWKELHIQYQHIGKWDLFVSLIWNPLKTKEGFPTVFKEHNGLYLVWKQKETSFLLLSSSATPVV